jgi:hypothetical protein
MHLFLGDKSMSTYKSYLQYYVMPAIYIHTYIHTYIGEYIHTYMAEYIHECIPTDICDVRFLYNTLQTWSFLVSTCAHT